LTRSCTLNWVTKIVTGAIIKCSRGPQVPHPWCKGSRIWAFCARCQPTENSLAVHFAKNIKRKPTIWCRLRFHATSSQHILKCGQLSNATMRRNDQQLLNSVHQNLRCLHIKRYTGVDPFELRNVCCEEFRCFPPTNHTVRSRQ